MNLLHLPPYILDNIVWISLVAIAVFSLREYIKQAVNWVPRGITPRWMVTALQSTGTGTTGVGNWLMQNGRHAAKLLVVIPLALAGAIFVFGGLMPPLWWFEHSPTARQVGEWAAMHGVGLIALIACLIVTYWLLATKAVAKALMWVHVSVLAVLLVLGGWASYTTGGNSTPSPPVASQPECPKNSPDKANGCFLKAGQTMFAPPDRKLPRHAYQLCYTYSGAPIDASYIGDTLKMTAPEDELARYQFFPLKQYPRPEDCPKVL